jgi:hypothetical protein
MAWVGPAIGAAGSVLGGIAGGKKSGGNQAPKWLRQGAKQLGAFGQDLAQQPYTPYEGNRVAPFSPDTQAAFDMIRNNVGTTQPYYSSALDTSQRLQNATINPQQVQASQWAGTDLSPYLNPYTNQVVDASLADLENQRAVQYNGLASQAQAAGAFGGSRFGVAQGQFEADALRNKSLLAAQLRNQGFETAAGLASADVDRLNQAKYANQSFDFQGQTATADMQNRNAFLTGILGDRMGAANAQDAEMLARSGSVQQAQAQRPLDIAYNDYLDQTRAYPTQQLNWWSSALQPGTSVAGAGTPPQSGGLLGTLGGAQLGAQVGNSVYDWWKGMSKPPQAAIDPYDSYNDWQG